VPTVDWGLSKGVIDDYDRESGYKPYTGKLPDNGVYQWQLTRLVYVSGTKQKNPQLRATFRLVARDKAEKKFSGYTNGKLMVIADSTPFQYVPFLDAIGVTDREFRTRTITDEDGNVKKIGSWKNDGEQIFLGQLQDNRGDNADKYPKEIGWVGPIEEEADGDEEFDEEDDSDDEDSDYDEEEEDAF